MRWAGRATSCRTAQSCNELPQPQCLPRGLDQLQPLQTRMPVLADNDVVVHGDAERSGDVDDRLGHLDIGLRGRRIATWMIMHQDYRKMPASPNSIDSDDLSCDANLATQKNRGGVQWLIGFALRGVGKRGSARSKAKRLQCTAATCSQLRSRPARR